VAAQLVHSKIINKTARQYLKPMGVIQKGRSRTWLDDRGWWLGVIEFQPSGWSRGTYLNVGVMWLWYERDYLAFNVGYRVEGFTKFQSEEQFTEKALRLAQRAAVEITKYRDLFPNVERASAYLTRKAGANRPWCRHGVDMQDYYDAGMAAGIRGKARLASRFLKRVVAEDCERECDVQMQARASQFLEMVGSPESFQRGAMAVVRRTRALLKLKSIERIDWQAGSQ
jgi:hypothetical protein